MPTVRLAALLGMSIALAATAVAQDKPADPKPAEPKPAAAPADLPPLPGGLKAGEAVPITLAKPATTYWLSVPKDYRPGRSRVLVLALHGAGDRPEFFVPVVESHAEEYGYVVAGPRSKGAAWASDDTDTVTAVLDDVCKRVSVDPDLILLLGNSSGAAMASEYIVRHHARFRAMALCVGGKMAAGGGAAKAAQAHLAVFCVTGEMDMNKPLVLDAHARFQKEGFDTVLKVVDGMGHSPLEDPVFDFVFTEFRKRIRQPVECLKRAQRALAEERWADAIKNHDGCRVADPAIEGPAAEVEKRLDAACDKLMAAAATKAKRDVAAARALYRKIAEDFDAWPKGAEAEARLAELDARG